MSQRPTILARTKCVNSQTSDNNYPYVIIGDTSVALLAAKRLLANGVTQNIYVLSEGVDRTNVAGIQDNNFVAVNNNSIFHYMFLEKIHLVPPGDNITQDDAETGKFGERIFHYSVGSGPLGDYISSFSIPRPGPWLSHSTNTTAQLFTLESSTTYPLARPERRIAKRIRDSFNIPVSNDIIVPSPSVGGIHHVMVHSQISQNPRRQLFLSEYNLVNEATNVSL